ncbi:MAG: hypothetical protein IKA09_05145 [Lachnospiraceae bacterium]|nr:hypothetical protein [Lachnospiraceae bacterium]
MARRKIVFVIVEGASDETALGIALNQVFDKELVHVHIMHGDITTRTGVNSKNIVAKVGNEVRTYATSNHYKASDFKQIIHIVDTDAAYLADDKISEDLECAELSYQDDGIHTSDVGKVVSRNKQKTDNLYRLRSCGNIWGVPYRVYYMSCNLDHVLYDKRNSTDEEKEEDAYTFAKKYKNNVGAFMDFMCKSAFSVKGDFKESWEFIETDMHSIERYTNLPICLQEEVKEREELSTGAK